MKNFTARLKSATAKLTAIFIALVCCSLFCACDDDEFIDEIRESYPEVLQADEGFSAAFSVNFIDVGNGDAIFINFADGKEMLIDCGERSERNLNKITAFLDALVVDGLDYLVLTHPDGDHVGNAADIIKTYTVKKAYIPYLLQPENYNQYNDAYTALIEKQVETVYSASMETIIGENYYAVFLTPNAYGHPQGSAYDKVNASSEPDSDAINDISPIIYLDYSGVRFIFTGDAGLSQEELAIDAVNLKLINNKLAKQGKPAVNLTDIDFLKVSHHGSADASGNEFLRRITPQNAVISVSGDNTYGHPTKETLLRIYNANENCNLYLTSVWGTVCVIIDDNGTTTVKTENKTAATA